MPDAPPTRSDRGCRCGLAGTNITPDGLCATCGEPLNRESVAWLAKDYGRLYTEHRQVVGVERLVERVRGIARDCGYAVAVHGSQQRDLDLIAVPWTGEAVSNRELVQALVERGPFAVGEKAGKPHGRVGYVLHGVPGSAGVKYIDLSVMPTSGEVYGTCNVCWACEWLAGTDEPEAVVRREKARRDFGGALLVRPGDLSVAPRKGDDAAFSSTPDEQGQSNG